MIKWVAHIFMAIPLIGLAILAVAGIAGVLYMLFTTDWVIGTIIIVMCWLIIAVEYWNKKPWK